MTLMFMFLCIFLVGSVIQRSSKKKTNLLEYLKASLLLHSFISGIWLIWRGTWWKKSSLEKNNLSRSAVQKGKFFVAWWTHFLGHCIRPTYLCSSKRYQVLQIHHSIDKDPNSIHWLQAVDSRNIHSSFKWNLNSKNNWY